ncbi:MAG TPA: hypothetical protein VNZ26_16280 [Vicinamibacterales bacterium]|jgi:hypothetical protein|nr:hypothetical protein [Vicinamibacterales bacterium]
MSRAAKKVMRVVFVLVLVAAAGVAVWTTTCPCNNVPGFVLLGDVHKEPVTDWRFANDVALCQIQINTGRGPHSINLNCMATPDGHLFLSCSVATRKYWCQQVEKDQPARLRLSGVVYPVVLNREMDQATLDRVWAARMKKLQVYGGGPYNPKPAPDAKRPDSWWSFQVLSRNSE